MVAGGSLKGVGMICVVVASLSIEWYRHTGSYRFWGVPMGQLPGTVVVLHAQDNFILLPNSVPLYQPDALCARCLLVVS